LSLRSESAGCLVLGVALTCLLNREKTGRRFWTGGGELVVMGEDGGLDRGTSSDHGAGELFELDVGGSAISRGGSESIAGTSSGSVLGVLSSVVCTAHSTRLRLAGGSAS
jgi:hypothetical protein